MPRTKRFCSGFTPRNESQQYLLDNLESNDLVLAVGPAGTGKTYAAVAIGVSLHRQKYIHKIIIARPTIGAGESNGYLPGTIEEKLKPYMVPIYECLESVGGPTYEHASFVEVVAFEHLRGRTFKDSFVIVDEAQNATLSQLETVLTRLGEGSKMVLTGDPNQCDLRPGTPGLHELVYLAQGVDWLPVVQFTEADNLRHPIVAKLTKLFATYKECKLNK